jgi:FMN phosphatase YigB (HAD superfamily)
MFKDKRVLILDLDETLVHSGKDNIESCFESVELSNGNHVCFRPYLFSFLLAARNHFELVILWSNGGYNYVHEVVGIIKERGGDDVFDEIYTLEDASWLMHRDKSFPFKDLYWLIDKHGLDKEECIMFDDGILITSFYPDIVHQVSKFLANSTNKYDRQLLDYKDMMAVQIFT